MAVSRNKHVATSVFLHKFCRLKKSLKAVVGAQNVSDKQGSNMLQTITGIGFFVKINRQTAQSHASNLKLRQSLTNRAVML